MLDSTTSICPFQAITNSAMHSTFNRTPRPFQSAIISHLLKMMAFEIPPEPVLMIQPTGSGKSTIPLTCSIVTSGVTIVVENTLALSSDQTSKISSLVTTGSKDIKAYQLDIFKLPHELRRLVNAILKHTSLNVCTSIICFTSPETLLNPICIRFVKKLIDSNKLNLLCIDEIHLFLEFGISFRPIFQDMKTKIIKLLHKDSKSLKVPLLMMTATFDLVMFNMIQKMLGINIDREHVFWAEYFTFQKRHINIEIKYSIQSYKSTTDEIKRYFSQTDDNKGVIICSTASKAKEVQTKLDHWLDSNESIEGDTVLVVGDLDTETKFAYTTRFTNSSYGVAFEPYSSERLCPRFMIGTPGCIGAGLDCNHVNLVCRIGLPTSIIHFIQEMGRCGRDPYSSYPNTYTIVFHLHDYVYLIERLYKVENDCENNKTRDTNDKQRFITVEEERKYYIDNLNKLCRMLFCNYGCWHACLESISSNPFTKSNQRLVIPPCINHCPYCMKSLSKFIKPVSKSGLQSFLVSTQMSNHNESYTPTMLVKKLIDYPLVGRVIYGRQSATKIEKSSDASVTILQLLCCEILHLYVKEDKNPQSVCILSRTGPQPHYLLDNYWHSITHF